MAMKSVFKDEAYKIPISSTKSMIGHALGGAGAIEGVAVVKSILTGTIHPTINYDNPDPDCDLNYTPNKKKEANIISAMSNSFGFGGHNASLIFQKVT